MMLAGRQTRFASSRAQKLLKQFVDSWGKGDVEGAKSVFGKGATISFASDTAIPRVPFSGVQSPEAFFANFAKGAELKFVRVAPGTSVGSDDACAAVVECGAVINRVEKESQITSLVHGQVADDKLRSLVFRSGTGEWEEAFSAHGSSIKGTERTHF